MLHLDTSSRHQNLSRELLVKSMNAEASDIFFGQISQIGLSVWRPYIKRQMIILRIAWTRSQEFTGSPTHD